MTSQNTHDYDGKIEKYYESLLQKYDNIPNENKKNKTFDECIDEIKIMINLPIFADYKKNAMNSLNIISLTNQLNIIDKTDNINVHDILIKIWSLICNHDPSNLIFFIEQLADISVKGACIQGQSKRLMQVFKCIVDT